MPVIGLTGGIGSGKSTVSAALAERGADIVDADAITRSLQEPGGTVHTAMVEHFGDSIVDTDGRLDRAAIAEIVFNDSDQLEALNGIVHPMVGKAMRDRVESAGSGDIVILDVPLLAEGRTKDGKSKHDMAAVLVVDCPVDIAVERLVSDRGFDEADARARIANQATREDRLEMADFVIDNGGSLDNLAGQIEAAWQWMESMRDERDLTAADVAWMIDDLVVRDGLSVDASVDAWLDEAETAVGRVQRFKGQLSSIASDRLVELMREIETIEEAIYRAGSYAQLRFSVDTGDGALFQAVQERAARLSTQLLFVELEWAALDDDVAESLLSDPDLEFCAHYLRSSRRYRDHLLSESEEAVLTEKSVTGSSAWSRLFSQLSSEITVETAPAESEGDDSGGRVSLAEALAQLASPDPEVRRGVAQRVNEGLQPTLSTRAFIYNTLLADKSTDDRLRSYPSWVSSRNLSNEATDESVQALIDAVVSRYDIPHRWYGAKAEMLGIELHDYDRMASVAEAESEVGWREATELVIDAYDSFSPKLADVARRFVDEKWIDGPVRPSKRPGAFCSYAVPSHHPYVFLNWTGKSRDVMTLAHELGHGCHAYLSRPQGLFHFQTPLTLAETASVFGETVTFNRVLEHTTDPAERLALLAENIEGSIATVFRQTAMNRFEDAAHDERREVGELSVERFGELWVETQADMLGDSVTISEGYRDWWSYVPHFIATPGYVYAYAYGQLLALSVYHQYEIEGPDFVEDYLGLLSAGGSLPPEDLGAKVGCDLTDPDFWHGGLSIVESQLDAALKAAGRA
ncbi:MAG: dephospho-CoA kinase [Actinomycetia bacterium]|nr:dephospho-CoA kinase [Actinomycetes bacterium]